MEENVIELFANAIASLGEATDEELSEYLYEKHGVRVEAKYVSIVRATLVDKRRNKPTKRETKKE